MNIEQVVILMVIGLIAGFVGGTMGVGGGIVMVPALIFVLGFTQHQAQGTSLATMVLPIGILGVVNYYKEGYVNFRFAFILAITFIIGSYLGSKLAVHMPDKMLKQIFGGLIIIVGARLILGK